MTVGYELQGETCVLTLDAPPLNVLSFELIEALLSGVRRANADPAVRGILITGTPGQFSAGLDVHLLKELDSAVAAERLSAIFQETFDAIEDSAKPVVAGLSGFVLGGALELATACHARVATPSARFRMPEVTLGIVPGAGGTQRLPRLIGVPAALRMLVGAETIDAAQSLEWGLIDAVADHADQFATAERLITACPAKTRARGKDLLTGDALAQSLVEAERQLAAPAEVIAPRRIIAALRTGVEQGFAAGLAAERKALAESVLTPAAQNKIYLFFATRETGNLPGLPAGRPITSTAVVGLGSMGTGIAHALLQSGFRVLAYDEQPDAVGRARDRIGQSLARRVAQGRMSQAERDETLARFCPAATWQDLAPADVVIEAAFEDAAVKRAVFARLEEVCKTDAILGTNTSTISLDALAAEMRHPGRLVGMHFFNPAQRMPLVEIIHRRETPPEVLAQALALARALRKTPIVVKNREGFLVTRIFVPYLQEAFALLAEGVEPAAVDTALAAFGFPQGPLALIDMAGLDIMAHAHGVLCRAFPRHGPLSPIVARLVAGGHLGQKTGQGVYCYTAGERTPRASTLTAEILAEVRRATGHSACDLVPDAIAERLVLRMVAEATYVLDEGLVRSPAEIDVATVLGLGFPDYRGGLMRYADALGPDAVRVKLAALAHEHGERFCPADSSYQ